MLLLEFYGMGGCVNIYHEFCMHHGNELERRFEAYFFGEFGHMLNFWMDCKNLKSWHMQIWVSAFQNVWALFRFASNMCPICIFKDLLSVLGNGKHIFRFFFCTNCIILNLDLVFDFLRSISDISFRMIFFL